MITDERYKQIMSDLGAANSQGLLTALKQVANEVAQQVRAEYQAKPKLTEVWVWEYPNGDIGSCTYKRKLAHDSSGTGRVMVLMRKVTE